MDLTNDQRREINRLLEKRAGHAENAKALIAGAEGENRGLRASGGARDLDTALAQAEELGQRPGRLERFYSTLEHGSGRTINPNDPDKPDGSERTLPSWLRARAGSIRNETG